MGITGDVDPTIVGQGVAGLAEGDEVGQDGSATVAAELDMVSAEAFPGPTRAAAMAVAGEDFVPELRGCFDVVTALGHVRQGFLVGRRDHDFLRPVVESTVGDRGDLFGSTLHGASVCFHVRDAAILTLPIDNDVLRLDFPGRKLVRLEGQVGVEE